ncbi:hypothetical protein BC829DRAFT_421537 [Chytridium lagenaria]|nr:hypothetical protein BC829DRAFT_421537 [Chytridium lagenaria]
MSTPITGSASNGDIRKRIIKRVEELTFDNSGNEQDALIFLARYRSILEQGTLSSSSRVTPAFFDMDDAFNSTKNAEKMFRGGAKWFSGSCTNADTWESFVKEFRTSFAEKVTDAKIVKDVDAFHWDFDSSDAPKKAWARLRDMNNVLPRSKRMSDHQLRKSFILSCSDLDWSNTAQTETFDGQSWDSTSLDMNDLFRGMASKVRFNAGSSSNVNSTMINTLKALEQRLANMEKRATPGSSPIRKPLINYAFTSFEDSLPTLVHDRNFMDKFVKTVSEYAREDYRSLDPEFPPPSMPEILAFEAKLNDFRRDPDQFRRSMAKPMAPASTFKGGWTNQSRENSLEPPRTYALLPPRHLLLRLPLLLKTRRRGYLFSYPLGRPRVFFYVLFMAITLWIFVLIIDKLILSLVVRCGFY